MITKHIKLHRSTLTSFFLFNLIFAVILAEKNYYALHYPSSLVPKQGIELISDHEPAYFDFQTTPATTVQPFDHDSNRDLFRERLFYHNILIRHTFTIARKHSMPGIALRLYFTPRSRNTTQSDNDSLIS